MGIDTEKAAAGQFRFVASSIHSEPGRVHFSFNTAYNVKLWSKLNWNISFYDNWDNRPPPSFSGSDYGTSTGLSWKFGSQ
jgi:hypothetical protein